MVRNKVLVTIIKAKWPSKRRQCWGYSFSFAYLSSKVWRTAEHSAVVVSSAVGRRGNEINRPGPSLIWQVLSFPACVWGSASHHPLSRNCLQIMLHSIWLSARLYGYLPLALFLLSLCIHWGFLLIIPAFWITTEQSLYFIYFSFGWRSISGRVKLCNVYWHIQMTVTDYFISMNVFGNLSLWEPTCIIIIGNFYTQSHCAFQHSPIFPMLSENS